MLLNSWKTSRGSWKQNPVCQSQTFCCCEYLTSKQQLISKRHCIRTFYTRCECYIWREPCKGMATLRDSSSKIFLFFPFFFWGLILVSVSVFYNYINTSIHFTNLNKWCLKSRREWDSLLLFFKVYFLNVKLRLRNFGPMCSTAHGIVKEAN